MTREEGHISAVRDCGRSAARDYGLADGRSMVRNTVMARCQAGAGGLRMCTDRKRRWIVADVTEEDREACVASAAMRRALRVALDAIEGIRQPLDDLGGEDGNGAVGRTDVRYTDLPSETPTTG